MDKGVNDVLMDEVQRAVNKQRLARMGRLLPPNQPFVGVCEHCKEEKEVRVGPVRTAYADDKQNVAPVLCAECMEAYNQHWDEMWEEYYGGLL